MCAVMPMFMIMYLPKWYYRIIIKYGKRYETETAKFCEETFVVKRQHTKVQVSNVFIVGAKSCRV